jgi:hypothetical protein
MLFAPGYSRSVRFEPLPPSLKYVALNETLSTRTYRVQTAAVGSGFLDRRFYQVAPLGPRAVVITDPWIAEQMSQYKPGVG